MRIICLSFLCLVSFGCVLSLDDKTLSEIPISFRHLIEELEEEGRVAHLISSLENNGPTNQDTSKTVAGRGGYRAGGHYGHVRAPRKKNVSDKHVQKCSDSPGNMVIKGNRLDRIPKGPRTPQVFRRLSSTIHGDHEKHDHEGCPFNGFSFWMHMALSITFGFTFTLLIYSIFKLILAFLFKARDTGTGSTSAGAGEESPSSKISNEKTPLVDPVLSI